MSGAPGRRRWVRGLWSLSGACGCGWSSGGAVAVLGPCPSQSPSAAPPSPVPRLPSLQARHCPLPRPQAPNKALASILGKSNLRFAGMSIAVSISTDGLNLSVPATRQVSATTCIPSRSGQLRGLVGGAGGVVGAGLCVDTFTWRCAETPPH